jgi:carboxyl-terminal processing protease
MKTLLRALIALSIGVVFVSGTFFAGMATQQTLATARVIPSPTLAAASTPVARSSLEADFAVFWEVWGIIKSEFIGTVPDDKAMTYGAIQGVVSMLGDQHTHFDDPVRANLQATELDGKFEGIGATVEMQNGRIVIVTPLKGRPAEKAGLLPGDIVTQIDGKSTEGLSLTEAISRIRGPKGTQVTLTVVRANSPTPIDITITRATIEVEAVTTKKFDNGIVYLSLSEFTAPASDEVDKALRDLLKDNPKGLIFDLRGNPGGYLNTAITIVSEFISDGVVLSEVDKSGNKRDHRAVTGGRATKIPLAVLINKGSASASELVSGAIKDRKRGILIGETTFGKGSVQVSHTLSDKSRFTVTVRHWLTPNGHDIHEKGIDPDIFVPGPTETDKRSGRDPQVDRAIEYLLTGK